MKKLVKAEAGPGYSVIYTDTNGRRFISIKGDKNFRHHNPGNLVPGKVSRRNGQIGVVRGFAVFPDLDTGRKALEDSLKNNYGGKSLEKMIKSYAPEHENDTAGYLRHLRRRTGVVDDRLINTFTKEEFSSLVQAITDMEGRDALVLQEIRDGKKQILRIMKDKKGVITHYFAQDLGWLSKDEAIEFTRRGEIDAVIAISSAGTAYLRTRPDVIVVNNLENKD